MAAPSPQAVQKEFRRCLNIKSRANPDVQCPCSATHGDYCSRHFKNPRPFRPAPRQEPDTTRTFTRADQAAARRIQGFWRREIGPHRFRTQGPAANARSLATNDTELYSMDPLSSIPNPYFFSLADSRRVIWGFDIRSLIHTMGTGEPVTNPYIREVLTPLATRRLHDRVAWLRKRRYHVLYVNTDVLTAEQVWNQRVLDSFLKIEALGYYANCDWFQELGGLELALLYNKLYNLWEWRLGLTPQQKEQIVPGHLAGGTQRLFRFPPGQNMDREKAWWQRTNMTLIENFVTRATDKEQQKLGAMYVLMGLVQVSRPAARALPWVVEILHA